MADRKALKRRQDILSLSESDNGYFGKGVKFTLFPNGEKGVIWVSDGINGMAIKIGKGSRGLNVTINRHAGSAPMTMSGNQYKTEDVIPQMDTTEVSLTQYSNDPKAQAFKRWYGLDGTSEGDDDPAHKAAHTAGRKCAQDGFTEKQIQAIEPPLPELGPPMCAQHFWRGYFAQLAGLYDK